MIVAANRCQVCGCTETTPCDFIDNGVRYNCGWLDAEHTLCSNPRCVAKIPLRELERLVIVG